MNNASLLKRKAGDCNLEVAPSHEVSAQKDLVVKKRQRTIIDFFARKPSSDQTIDASLCLAEKKLKEDLSIQEISTEVADTINAKENLINKQNCVSNNQNSHIVHFSGKIHMSENNEIKDVNEVSNNKVIVTRIGKTQTNTLQKFNQVDDEHWKNVLGDSWYEALKDEIGKSYFKQCVETVNRLRATQRIYPPENMMFNAFTYTPLNKVTVVIVGQDPYHQPGQAMGLCFSVRRGVTPPPSLKNMFKEIGIESRHGDLSSWAKQGVFMINSLLSVVEGCPMAHKDLGWSNFTDKVIDIINQKCEGVVFLLWGRPAQKKALRVDRKRHYVLEAGHPSPLSIKHFQGCDHFNKCNEILKNLGKAEIVWILPP